MLRFLVSAWLLCAACSTTAVREPEDVLDEVWETARAQFYDPELKGVDWPAARERARTALEGDRSLAAASAAVNGMLAELASSHTAFFTTEDPAYYVLLELFWESLEPERRARFFPHGPPPLPGIGILTETAALEDGGSAFFAFLRALLSGARIVERDGARLAYAHLWSYAGEELHESLRELLLTGPLGAADGLVLDLRGGFGGANPEYLQPGSSLGSFRSPGVA